MKSLYLVERTDSVGYDEYDACVVCATSMCAALDINVESDHVYSYWLGTPRKVSYIGIAASHIEEGSVVLASYNAG